MEKNIDFSEISNGNECLKYELDINFNTFRLLANHVQELLDMNNSIEKLACLIDEKCNLHNRISQSYDEECTKQDEAIKGFIVMVSNEIEKLETLQKASILPSEKMTKNTPDQINDNEMEEYMKFTFNEFLEAVKGSTKKHVDPNFIFIFPGSSKLDTIQVYNYLEMVTRNFDPGMVKLILNSLNTYLDNMNNSFGYNEFFGKDAFELDQFVELRSILGSKLGNNHPIAKSSTVNPLEIKEKFELKMLEGYDSSLNYNVSDSIYYQKKFEEFKEVSLRGNMIPMSESTFIEMQIKYFNALSGKLELTQINDISRVQNYIGYLDRKKICILNRSDNTKDSIPQKAFEEYLQNGDKIKLIKLLHSLLDNAKSKEFAKFIIALSDLNYIHIPNPRNSLYQAMRNEFGNIGTDSALNGYLCEKITTTSKTKIIFQEIETTKALIEKYLNT